MDAFAFVLGTQTKNLRTKKLQNLLHRTKDRPVDSNSIAKVSLHFEERESTDDTRSPIRATTVFSRIILSGGMSSEYRIDNRKVTSEHYDKKLRSLGIIVKAKNCLAFDVHLTITTFFLKTILILATLISIQSFHIGRYSINCRKRSNGAY